MCMFPYTCTYREPRESRFDIILESSLLKTPNVCDHNDVSVTMTGDVIPISVRFCYKWLHYTILISIGGLTVHVPDGQTEGLALTVKCRSDLILVLFCD